MPEYLAPGVYVEEVDTGSKPIEGVSTSTAGMVGVTERGPVGVPVLITSVGDYQRVFGGQLNADDYDEHRFFPHAIEGFFTNGGKRVYVVRVLNSAASKASSPLFDRGDAGSVTTRMIRAAGEGTGSAATQPGIVVLDPGALAPGNWIRIGDGSPAEYRQFDSSAPDKTMVVLQQPLSHSLTNTITADEFARSAPGPIFTLVSNAKKLDTEIVVKGLTADITALNTAASAGNCCIEIGGAIVGEYRLVMEAIQQTVLNATDSSLRLKLDAGLQETHAATDPVVEIDFTGAVINSAPVNSGISGESLLYVDNRAGLQTRVNLVRLTDGATVIEVKRIGELDQLDLVPGSYSSLSVGALVESVVFAPARSIAVASASPASVLTLAPNETDGLVAGQQVVVDPIGVNRTVTITAVNAGANAITITPAVNPAPAVAVQVLPASKKLTAAVDAGKNVLALDDRMGIEEKTVLQVGSGTSAELVTVVSVHAESLTPPNPGNVVVEPALQGSFAAGLPVAVVSVVPRAGRQSCVLAISAEQGDEEIFVSDGQAYVATEMIRVTTPSGLATFHTLAGSSGPIAPQMVNLTTPLSRAHSAGSMIAQRKPLFDVQALDAGIWGNRLKISIQDEEKGLVNSTIASATATTIRLHSPSGVQAGTILEFFDTVTGAVQGNAVKVSNINRSANNLITIQGGLAPAQQTVGLGVRSREFRLTVYLLRQPDPSTPTRDDQSIDREDYRNLSMDPRHPHFIEKAIGAIDGFPLRLWDRRPEGASTYIRVQDRAANLADSESVRMGPETLTDVLRSGQIVPAKQRLDETLGDDAISSLSDKDFKGDDPADPRLRTGLNSLKNIEDVAIVAMPSQTGPDLQEALIDHCELMRYRFAVLDSVPEPDDTLANVQKQRQQFDTKYAALYYPWLSIPDPYPTNLANIQEYAIPPAGHVVGVYARTDIERGVHKAPANEVVRGIIGLRRKLNKEQQDVLNPYPVNINVIRDFRDHNRGIRVYGGRCITSDTDWKYVNVRRLLIFIEHSIDLGLQWVVFEPNAEPLWSRVTRSVKNFLKTIWRNGALEGTKVEEAFYVRCDRTTMTQDDIDNGRLIVLIGVAPVKPAEFVIIRIGLWTARSDS
jgi:phage tail sheath protein FI